MDSDTESDHTTESVESEDKFILEAPTNLTESETKFTKPILTKYEIARILGIRAEQLSRGAPPMIDIGDLDDAYNIAIAELKQKSIPFLLKRRLPDGTYEVWNLKDMFLPPYYFGSYE